MTRRPAASETTRYPVPEAFAAQANLSREDYTRMYAESIDDPEGFWMREGRRVTWMRPYTRAKTTCFQTETFKTCWFEDGVLNASVNCLDRHLESRGDKTALIWESDCGQQTRQFTFAQLHLQVCRFANVLKRLGVARGDRVTLYLPMIPETVFAMLACARIGAIHSVVFAGFSPDSLASRLRDCESDVLITADEGLRGGRKIPLKASADEAAEHAGGVRAMLVVRHTGADVEMEPGRDVWLHDCLDHVDDECRPEPMAAEDPLFILYTSGSTGRPKGVVHTTGGYMVWTSITHQYAFDLKDDDVHWCSADLGWITGHSYVVYGPLCNGTTTVMFEGVPTYPDASRFWQVIDKHQVTAFYTAPTAIRALMKEGEAPVQATSRRTLRLLATAGEPINPEAWEWFFNVVGEGRCPIVDTWWQTETGGAMVFPLPGATDMKPGAGSHPFFGIRPALLDANGQEIEGSGNGNLVITDSWPGQMRTIYGDHRRFLETYFTTYAGRYFTGDGCRRDLDGFYWITGRVDDVLNVSGHRMGTAEIESAFVSHAAVAEAAVVGYPHDIKGQGIYAYVTLRNGHAGDEALRRELVRHVRHEIGPVATPDLIQFAPGLPKTRSGKIMRRILRKIAEDEFSNLGDTSTLAEPDVVQQLIDHRQNRL